MTDVDKFLAQGSYVRLCERVFIDTKSERQIQRHTKSKQTAVVSISLSWTLKKFKKTNRIKCVITWTINVVAQPFVHVCNGVCRLLEFELLLFAGYSCRLPSRIFERIVATDGHIETVVAWVYTDAEYKKVFFFNHWCQKRCGGIREASQARLLFLNSPALDWLVLGLLEHIIFHSCNTRRKKRRADEEGSGIGRYTRQTVLEE